MIIDDLPDGPDPAIDSPSVFSTKAATMVLALKKMVVQFKAAIAELNTWLAGGAYAIPYLLDPSTAMARPGGKYLRFNSAAQNTATLLALDLIGGDLKDYTSTLNSFSGSTSSVLGTLRLVKQGDTSKFLTFNITAVTTPGSWKQLAVTCIESSSASPFVSGDAIMLLFQRTGDKGDTGAAAISQSVKFSDRKASGTAGGTATGNSITQTRTINTTEYNTIPSGVSLASNQMTIPAGTYDVRGRAPAQAVGAHKAFLYNVTDGSYALLGSSTYSGSGAGSTASDSVFSGRITIAASKAFAVRHYTSSSGATSDLGVQVGTGQSEVYTEVEFIKVG